MVTSIYTSKVLPGVYLCKYFGETMHQRYRQVYIYAYTLSNIDGLHRNPFE